MIGVIDVGSNSVRLMIAQRKRGDYQEIHHEVKTTRLIEGMKDGMPTREAAERTLAAMRDFAVFARSAGCEAVVAFATSAMRDARNRDELIARAAEFQLPVELMSGEDEALLAYLAVRKESQGRIGVIDIGGGSTELIVGEDGRVLASACVPVGGIRLRNELRNAPPEVLVSHAESILRPAWLAVSAFPADEWIGISGTMKCIKALEIGVRDWNRIAGEVLTREYTLETLNRLSALSLDARRALPGMEPDRADMLHFGAAILSSFFNITGISEIRITGGGNNMLGYARLRFPA